MDIEDKVENTYVSSFSNLGTLKIRAFELENDIDLLHSWVVLPYAKYWGMQRHTKKEVFQEYYELLLNPEHQVFIGELNATPIFLMESYNPRKDVISSCYEVVEGDVGMHILVAPIENRIPQFTWNVFKSVMDFLFSHKEVKRVVVEPDVNNHKIHELNKKAGFKYIKKIQLLKKKAHLAICNRYDYEQNKKQK